MTHDCCPFPEVAMEVPSNESYKGDNAEAGPFFDYAKFVVEPDMEKLTIQVPAHGWIGITKQGWHALVSHVNHQFEHGGSKTVEVLGAEEVEDGKEESD